MARASSDSGFRILRVFGIPIYVHASWFIIFALITFTLITQFTAQHPAWTRAQHLTLGLLTSALFFASVVFHELSHSVVALRYHIPVQSITLFVFGGVSEIRQEPANARQEFNIAIAGPISSLLLAGGFWLVAHFFHGNEMVVAAAGWLAPINFWLAVFNLIPGFPLDGGRVLRGISWGITGNFTRATRIASNAGKIFAYLMILGGIWMAFNHNPVGGLWIAFIGWFLLNAAQESFWRVAVRDTLTGVRAADVMTHDVPTVVRDMSLEEYVHEVLRTGVLTHIVTNGSEPVGLVSLNAARTIPREDWTNTSVQAAMLPADRIQWVSPEEPVLAVLERMQGADISQMPVLSEGHIVGMIARDTILRVLQTRLQVGHLAPQ